MLPLMNRVFLAIFTIFALVTPQYCFNFVKGVYWKMIPIAQTVSVNRCHVDILLERSVNVGTLLKQCVLSIIRFLTIASLVSNSDDNKNTNVLLLANPSNLELTANF